MSMLGESVRVDACLLHTLKFHTVLVSTVCGELGLGDTTTTLLDAVEDQTREEDGGNSGTAGINGDLGSFRKIVELVIERFLDLGLLVNGLIGGGVATAYLLASERD